MNLVIYADESGTHDGSDFSFLAGWIADEKFWHGFVMRWQAVLDKYKVDSFHFKDYAHTCSLRNNPQKKHEHDYESEALKHLSSAELDRMFKKCAALLAHQDLEFEVAILERKKFFDDKKSANKIYPPSVYDKNPECYLVEGFINRCTSRILEVWQLAGKPVQSVKFVFDDRNDKHWRQSIKLVLDDFKKWRWPMQPVEFKTKKEAIPIQAADMLAYRSLQITRNVGRGKVLTQPMSALDIIIANRVHPPGTLKSPI